MTDAKSVVGGYLTIHKIVRRNMGICETWSRYLAETANNEKEDQTTKERFVEFCEMTSILIHEHHDTEDHVWFPWCVENNIPNAQHIVDRLDSEHKTLMKSLNKLDNAISDAISQNYAETTFEVLAARWEKIRNYLLPHLQYEEEAFTVEVLSDVPKEALVQVEKDIMKHQKESPHATSNVPFLQFSMTPEEREVIKFPGIVTACCIPCCWKSKHTPYHAFMYNPPSGRRMDVVADRSWNDEEELAAHPSLDSSQMASMDNSGAASGSSAAGSSAASGSSSASGSASGSASSS